jgi:hypothetical protein
MMQKIKNKKSQTYLVEVFERKRKKKKNQRTPTIKYLAPPLFGRLSTSKIPTGTAKTDPAN